MNAQYMFYSLYQCHHKGRDGSPTYDSAGFELDYDKVAEWRKPQAYNNKTMIRNMGQALDRAESEEKRMFEQFFDEMPEASIDTRRKMKDYVKDHVSKDLDIPWHQITSEKVKLWREKGFQPVKYEDWWKELTVEESKRMLKMMSGASLRK
jgi:hypothetical protein